MHARCGALPSRSRVLQHDNQRMKTILITGAAGDVGTHLRRELAGHYQLKVSDLRSLKKLNQEEKSVRADISKISDARGITNRCDAVSHLGRSSVEDPWEQIIN